MLVGSPVITSGTPVSTPLLPTSATTRTTSAMCSGSQAISVRIENVPTSTHPGAGTLSMELAGEVPAPLSGRGAVTVSPGGTTPLSDGQLHWRLGKSSCSATARKLRLAPSMVSVTGVA